MPGMIVVTNRIPVARGHEIDFEETFAGPNVLEVHEVLTSTDLDPGP